MKCTDREMTLMVVWKVMINVIGSQKLQHCIAKELHSLVITSVRRGLMEDRCAMKYSSVPTWSGLCIPWKSE